MDAITKYHEQQLRAIKNYIVQRFEEIDENEIINLMQGDDLRTIIDEALDKYAADYDNFDDKEIIEINTIYSNAYSAAYERLFKLIVCGILYKHNDGTYSLWQGNLTNDETRTIQEILNNHETDGYSIRGKYDEIIKESE